MTETYLSEEELRIIALVAEGFTNEEIGHRVSLPEGTIKSQIARIGRRAGVKSRTQLVNWAWQHGHLGDHAALTVENAELRNRVDNLETMYRVAVNNPGDVYRYAVISALDEAERALNQARENLSNIEHSADSAETLYNAALAVRNGARLAEQRKQGQQP